MQGLRIQVGVDLLGQRGIIQLRCLLLALQSNSSCAVEVTLSPGWTNPKDNSTIVSVNVNIINRAPVAVAVPWVLTLKNSFYGDVQQVRG